METKKYKIAEADIQKIFESDIGCIASDKITVYGEKVGYMYREDPDETYDSGWRFFSGIESQDYTDDANNFSYYKINTIANYDSDILPYIDMPIGSALERVEGTRKFILVEV